MEEKVEGKVLGCPHPLGRPLGKAFCDSNFRWATGSQGTPQAPREGVEGLGAFDGPDSHQSARLLAHAQL